MGDEGQGAPLWPHDRETLLGHVTGMGAWPLGANKMVSALRSHGNGSCPTPVSSGFPDSLAVKNLPANAGDTRDVGSIPRLEDPLEESIEIYSRILAWDFPHSSAGKESTCNAGDPGLIPGLGRSPGERIGYPLQYSWASIVAQLVKNPPAMWETWGWSLGWEDPLEKGKATHSHILAWRIPWTV